MLVNNSNRLRGVLLAALLLCGTALLAAAQSRVAYVSGTVEIDRGERTIAASIGTAVQQADVIRTGPAALAIVELADGAEIKMRESSRVELASLSDDTTVRLEQGSMFSRVVDNVFAGDYSVETGTVAAGVRGTEFFVAYGRTVEERPDVWLCVNEGVVDVSVVETGESAAVEAGEGINILAGTRLTDPQFFDWTRELNWNMDPDAGDVADDTDLDQAYSDLLDQDYD